MPRRARRRLKFGFKCTAKESLWKDMNGIHATKYNQFKKRKNWLLGFEIDGIARVRWWKEVNGS